MIKKIKLLENINWNTISKDVAKFYALLAASYLIALLGIWVWAHFSIESYLIEGTPREDLKAFDPNLYKRTTENVLPYLLIPACFLTFFSLPPKKFMGISLTALAILLIKVTALSHYSLPELRHDFLWLVPPILLVWLLSCAWHGLKNKA